MRKCVQELRRICDCAKEYLVVCASQVQLLIIWEWAQFHVMPRELFGLNISTFDVSMKLLKVFPLWFVDKCLVYSSWLTLGGTAKYHLTQPEEGPLTMKARTGQTPVLDVGTVAKIRSGDIKVYLLLTYN